MHKNYNDYELVDMIAENNEDAERVIFEKYRPLVIAKAKKYYAIAKTKGAEMNDLIQEGFIGLSEALRGYKDNRDAQFKTFASLCIEREIQTYVTKLNRQKHFSLNNSVSLHTEFGESNTPLMELISDEQANPMHQMLDRDNLNEIITELDNVLTDIEKQVFNLKVANFSYQEIATILDKPSKTVDNALQRIKIKVRKIIANN